MPRAVIRIGFQSLAIAASRIVPFLLFEFQMPQRSLNLGRMLAFTRDFLQLADGLIQFPL